LVPRTRLIGAHGSVTVIAALTCFVASATEVAVIVAVPAAIALTTPVVLTVATAVLLLVQFNTREAQGSASNVTVSVRLRPTERLPVV
jgi:hypothetical protein